MYSSVQIRGYRSIKSLRLDGLGRVNLFVGRNNSGKTAVLEAISLLASRGSVERLDGLLNHRGELVVLSNATPPDRVATDPRCIFPGHEMTGKVVTITGIRTGGPQETLMIRPQEPNEIQEGPASRYDPAAASVEVGATDLKLTWTVDDAQTGAVDRKVPLSVEGGLVPRLVPKIRSDGPLTSFVYAASVEQESAAGAYDEHVSMRKPEPDILNALRTVHPRLSQIRTVSRGRRGRMFMVKCDGDQVPVPLGSLGAGVFRLLEIAISLTVAKNAVMLVDEIDSGLHYSVMTDMWRMMLATAERLNVQVFATTHSKDCWTSLGEVLQSGVYDEHSATIQRLEDEGNKAIAYSVAEIKVAAAEQIEVR